MSKLFENKQLIHIIIEVIVISGLSIYFTQRNKKLTNSINELIQRLEEQEDIIQKHEKMIIKLSNMVEELNTNINLIPSTQTQSKKKSVSFKDKNNDLDYHSRVPIPEQTIIFKMKKEFIRTESEDSNAKVEEIINNVEEIYSDTEDEEETNLDSDSDIDDGEDINKDINLDSEIFEELEDLN